MSLVTTSPDVKYTEKDFLTLLPAIIQSIKNRYAGKITDFSSTNIIVIFADALATLGDMLSYNQDAYLRECYFSSAKLYSTVLRMARDYGYDPTGRTAATAYLRITLLQESLYPVFIPAGTIFTTADTSSLRFRTLGDTTIIAGPAGTFVDVWVERSEPFSETFEAAGEAYETFVTTRNPILRSGIDDVGGLASDVILITVDGIPFTLVDSFVDSISTDTHVETYLDNIGRLVIRFGDGINGVAAKGSVLIQGRVGGGLSGNNARITQGPSFSNTNGDSVILSYFNSVFSQGGADAETIESIKINAPLHLQVSNRTVSHQDFITNAERVSGVDRALPLTSEDDVTIEENKTLTVILTESPSNAQILGGSFGVEPSITSGVDDDIKISINGEPPQIFTLGTQANGLSIATALQAAIRAATPEFPLDNSEAYTNFLVDWEVALPGPGGRFILTSGEAGLNAVLEVFSDAPNDGSVVLFLDTASQTENTIGASPAAATVAAVLTQYIVENPVTNSHVVEVTGPEVNIINIVSEVRFASNVTTLAAKAEVRDNIRDNLITFFSPRLPTGIANPEIDFGSTIRFSDMISVVNGSDGVESVDEDTFMINDGYDDVPTGVREFPVLGGVSVREVGGGII